jgi:hypothetical protein
MPECAFHPGVETEVRCGECERYICPKDMVETPVGYKCRECARPARSQYVVVKPQQVLRAAMAGGAVGILGGVIVPFIPLFGIISGGLWGFATAEAARRASGGHREWAVGVVAVLSILVGAFAFWLVTHYVNPILVLIAIVAALIDLALIELR